MTTTSPHPPAGTSPLAGEVGRGGATPRSLVQKLRARPTASEVRLWRLLYGLRTDGYHFRKQVRIGSYVVDFACLHASLVIEVDGFSHESDRARSNDATRDDYLRGRGFTVLRFSSWDVMHEPDGVLTAVATGLEGRPRNHRGSSPPSPTLPARGRVHAGGRGTMEPQSPDRTSPLAGEVGRGGATRSKPARGTI
jgi:very-short-patch-repair endonuclease